MAREAGTLYIKVDGEQFSISGSVEVPVSTRQNEPMIDVAGNVVGYKTTYIAPYISATVFFTRDFPLDKVVNGTDMTVTAEFENGKVYTLSDAFWTGETPVNIDEGTVPIRLSGKKGIWG